MKSELTDKAPNGTIGSSHKIWMGELNEETFLKWLINVWLTCSQSRDKPVVLILDGHSSHTKNLLLIENILPWKAGDGKRVYEGLQMQPPAE